MISSNLAHTISQQIAADIQIEQLESDRLVVYMPFVYDDGDQCSVFLSRKGDTQWSLSDDGESLRRAAYSGVNLTTPAYSAELESLVAFYGASQNAGQLVLEADDESLTRSLFAFTQTCLEASWLPKISKDRKKSEGSKFVRSFERIAKSATNFPVERNWHHPVHDPKEIYPVDYMIAGRARQLYLFGVPNKYACQKATIACQHYKLTGLDFVAVAIYDHEEDLPKVATAQLNEICDRTFPRVSESRMIKKYLSETAALSV